MDSAASPATASWLGYAVSTNLGKLRFEGAAVPHTVPMRRLSLGGKSTAARPPMARSTPCAAKRAIRYSQDLSLGPDLFLQRVTTFHSAEAPCTAEGRRGAAHGLGCAQRVGRHGRRVTGLICSRPCHRQPSNILHYSAPFCSIPHRALCSFILLIAHCF